MSNKNINPVHCSHCGAPITTEICPYCNALTGINADESYMNYPEINCKEASIVLWKILFPMYFVLGFVFIVFITISGLLNGELEGNSVAAWIMCGIFGISSIVLFIIAIKPIFRYLKVKIKGKEIEATVYGDRSDWKDLSSGKTIKLLVNTKDGYRFILYQVEDTNKSYEINSKIKLLVYKDNFLILKNNI